MKFLLFFPLTNKDNKHKASPPLSLLALAAPLMAAGVEVEVVDARIEPDYRARVLAGMEDADLLGVSSMTGYQIADGLEVSAAVKRAFSDKPVAWGGYHPSLLAEQTVMDPNIDLVVRGQGEQTMLELAEHLDGRRALDDIAGLSYKRDGEVIHNADRKVTDINEFPAMPYDLVDIERYMDFNRRFHGDTRRGLSYVSSFGCPHACGFCSNPEAYGRKWKGLAAERVVSEVLGLVQRHNLDRVYFDDNNFFASKRRVREICQGFLDAPRRFEWFATIRPAQVLAFSGDDLKLIRDSGCTKFMMGAESGDDSVLKLINKGNEARDVLEATRRCRDHQIQPSYVFILGFPTESWQQMQTTLDFMKQLKEIYADTRTTTLFFTPFPGTPLTRLGEASGFTMPATLKDWSGYDARTVQTPWITRQQKIKVKQIADFYIPWAYPNQLGREKMARAGALKPLFWLFTGVCRARVRAGFYSLPWEWHLARRLKLT
ncbi:MAG: B12-binding domain-containing radical SAM protein [Actinobacteria bacterium]|nr:B12-binding domain-containing radical SAM protein [Actinomycetota bacterium]MCL6094116.1 B12-binding domain-containing radical SAM protein [Actinomycetota bacterium]